MGWIHSGQTPSLFLSALSSPGQQVTGQGGTGSWSYERNAWALFIPSVRNSLGWGALGWPSTSRMGRECWDEQDTEPAPT